MRFTLPQWIVVFFALAFLIIAACTPQNVACTLDAKICPDGSAVGRIPPSCEFAACPLPTPASCEYSNASKLYVARTIDECSRIRFTCELSAQAFTDECGCGCIVETDRVNKTNTTLPDEHSCTLQEKQAAVCTLQYQPVCGWFDPSKIQCIKYPCAIVFGNQCQACQHPDVIYTTQGECPTGY